MQRNSGTVEEHGGAVTSVWLGGVAAILLGVGFLSIDADADPWQFGGSVEGGAIYIDNLFLVAPDEQTEEEVLFLVAPEIWVSKESERLNTDVRYRMEAFHYPDFSDSDNIAHELDATASAVVLLERFFLDLSATAGQQLLDAQLPVALTNVPISGNRGEFSTAGVQPRWQQRIGNSELLMQSEYTRFFFDTDDIELDDRFESLFRVGNVFQEQGITWGLKYEHERYNYEQALPFEYQRADLTLGYWVTSGLRLFVSGGKETPIDEFLDPSMDSDIWEVGFQYVQDERFSIELAGGERGYGSAFRGDILYITPRGEMSLTYNEGPQSRSGAIGLAPSFEEDSLTGILDPLGSSDRFLQKRAELSYRLELPKTNLELRVFSDHREQVLTAAGEARPDESFEGVTLLTEWRAGAKTEFTLDLGLLRSDDFVRSGDLRHVGVEMNYQFGPRSSLALGVDWSSDDVDDVGGPSYEVTQVSLLLRRLFGAELQD